MVKPTKFWIDGIAATSTPDVTGEMLNIDGADISDLENGRGRINDNHSPIMFGHLGRVTEAKKIKTEEEAKLDPRVKYFWDKNKTPFIYFKGYLYNDEDHINSKAAIAILRNLYSENTPLQIGASVEGGVVRMGATNEKVLEKTKIHSVALTFVPCNKQSLVEPMELTKSLTPEEYASDWELIKSATSLAKSYVPSFRYVQQVAQAETISKKIQYIKQLGAQVGLNFDHVDILASDLLEKAILTRIHKKADKINDLYKALTAGYGAAGAPTNLTGGGVLQSSSVPIKKKENNLGLKYVTCAKCGNDQIFFPRQVKCRECGVAFSFHQLAKLLLNS